MDFLISGLGWTGIYAPVVLGAIGSIVGCARGGQAACGAILETETGHGRFVGLSAMPSSQTIYGVVVTMTLVRPVTAENAPALFVIGTLVAVALLLGAIYQGSCVAAAIQVSKEKPAAFGISAAPAAIVEGFAVFAFVFALVLSASIPQGG